MKYKYNLKRFLDAQQMHYDEALKEIKNGRKISHWMWFIFPQIKGLGFSETSKYYAVLNIAEAAEYLSHPILGSRLVAICKELLQLPGNNATSVFGRPDDRKLKSSMSLFAAVPHAEGVFEAVLQKYFAGEKDQQTLKLLSF